MVYLGKSKMDKTKRISLIKEVADLFEMADGDHILFFASDGKIIITKGTEGRGTESEAIAERIRMKEDELEEEGVYCMEKECSFCLRRNTSAKKHRASVKGTDHADMSEGGQNDISAAAASDWMPVLPADLTDNEKKICGLVNMNKNITVAGMAEAMGISRSTVKRVIVSLIAKDILSRDGADRGGSWYLSAVMQ